MSIAVVLHSPVKLTEGVGLLCRRHSTHISAQPLSDSSLDRVRLSPWLLEQIGNRNIQDERGNEHAHKNSPWVLWRDNVHTEDGCSDQYRKGNVDGHLGENSDILPLLDCLTSLVETRDSMELRDISIAYSSVVKLWGSC